MKKTLCLSLLIICMLINGCSFEEKSDNFFVDQNNELLESEEKISDNTEIEKEYISLEYFRQKIRDGETIDFTEYFYSFPQISYNICDKTHMDMECLEYYGGRDITLAQQFIITQQYFSELLSGGYHITNFLQTGLVDNNIPFIEYFTNPSLANNGKAFSSQPGVASEHQIVAGVIKVQGYFALEQKEEYFLCTETDDPTCFPASTGVYNMKFTITQGNTPGFQKGKSITVGCYDKANHNILYEYESVNLNTMNVQNYYTQFSNEQVEQFLQGIENKETKEYLLFIPPNASFSPDGRMCMNFFFINPVPVV